MWSRRITLCVGTLVAIGYTAVASTYEYEMIVLTDTRDQSQRPDEVQSMMGTDKDRQKILHRRESKRDHHLKKLRRIMEDMDRDGYAFVDASDLSTYDDFVDGTRELVRAPVEFAYVPIDLQKSVFANGTMVGKQPLFEDDGRVHQMAYVFEFDDLGTVIVDELNYATIPNTRITVNKPTGNLTINGYPATYTALMDRDSKKGLSAITYITDSKLITVTALKCITRKEKEEFDRLVEIASSAY